MVTTVCGDVQRSNYFVLSLWRASWATRREERSDDSYPFLLETAAISWTIHRIQSASATALSLSQQSLSGSMSGQVRAC